jgi:WD40 repeat protein
VVFSYETIFRSHTQAIVASSLNQKALLFATVSADKTIRLWNMKTAAQTVEFFSEADSPSTVHLSNNADIVFCGFSSGLIRVFDVHNAVSIAESRFHTSRIEELTSFSTENKVLLLAASLDKSLSVHDVENLTVLRSSIYNSLGPGQLFLEVSPDQTMAAFGNENILRLLSLPELLDVKLIGLEATELDALVLSQDTAIRAAKFLPNRSNHPQNADTLLIITDTYISVYHVTTEFSSKKKAQVTEKFQKKIEAGLVRCFAIDNVKNILFLGIQGKPKTETETKKRASSFNSIDFSICFILFMSGKNGVTLSQQQSFPLESSVTSMSYLEEEGKMIIGDSSGCLTIWKLNIGKIDSLREDLNLYLQEKKKFISTTDFLPSMVLTSDFSQNVNSFTDSDNNLIQNCEPGLRTIQVEEINRNENKIVPDQEFSLFYADSEHSQSLRDGPVIQENIETDPDDSEFVVSSTNLPISVTVSERAKDLDPEVCEEIQISVSPDELYLYNLATDMLTSGKYELGDSRAFYSTVVDGKNMHHFVFHTLIF